MSAIMPPRKRIDKNTPLYRWRHAVGLTLADAAERFGVSMSTYRRLESQKVLSKRYALAFEEIKRMK